MRKKARRPQYYVAQVGINTQLRNNPLTSDNPTPYSAPTAQTVSGPNNIDTTQSINPSMPDLISKLTYKREVPTGNLVMNPYVSAFNNVAQGVTAIADNITNSKVNRQEAEQYLRADQRFNDNNRGPITNAPAYTKYGGFGKYKVGGAYSTDYQYGGEGYETLVYDNDGDSDFPADALEHDETMEMLKAGGWIKGAVNPKHKGYCTPMTKSTCTPRRKAFAMTMKKHHGFHKAQTGGQQPYTEAEQRVVDRFTKMGYTVSRDANGGLKYTPGPNAQMQPNPAPTQTPQSVTQNVVNKAASQAATGNTNAPVQPNPSNIDGVTVDRNKLLQQAKNNKYLTDSNKRYYWGNLMNREFPNSGGNVRQAVLDAAKANNLDPNLLYASAMEEGMAGAIDSERSGYAGTDYVDWTNKNEGMADKYPVDGFYNYGLDQFAGQAKMLEDKGYLPKGFGQNFTTYKTTNEKGEKLNAPAFTSDQNALMAKSAMMRLAGDQLDTYAKKQGINLTDKQKQFFMLADYNGGEGNMQKMLTSYRDKGYLKNDDFINNVNFQPASYGQIYGNVQARMQSANLIRNNNYFAPATNTASNGTPAAAQTTMKAGGLSRKEDYGSKSHPYPSVKSSDFAGGHRSYPIPTKADARDALKLASLHHRPDVKAKVYARYPDLKKQYGGKVVNDLEMGNLTMAKTGGHWIQGAINPKHKGYCTPMTKSTCTPRRKALAMRFKHGDLHKGQTGGDLYNDVPQYEIDNNLLEMQMGGDIQRVEGLHPSQYGSANVEAERGEVYTDLHGNMNQVDPNGATHEQGGEKLPDVHRVLENTSNLRGDKVSKYLKLAPEQIKALVGLDTNKSMSHAEALIKANDAVENEKAKIVKNIGIAAKDRQFLDKYAENSTKLNIDHFRAMPSKEELFNRLFDHQEMTKAALGINNDGTQAACGGKYVMAQTGVVAYPGNTSGQLTPAGNKDAFPSGLTAQDYINQLKAAGVDVSNVKSNADLQRASYAFALKNNPDAIRSMWQQGIHNAGADRAIKAGLAYDKDDPSKGIKRGQFKPGVLDDSKNLQKLADLYPDNNLGVRILNLARGNKDWTDQDLPNVPGAEPKKGYGVSGKIVNNVNLREQPVSTFNEPLRWYDVASPVGTYLSAQRRLAERYNPADIQQVNLKQLDPTAALRANQEDFNAAVQAVNAANPYDIGTQMANIANLTSRKYSLNNQVMGNYDNQNAQIKNQETLYNANARDRQSAADQAARESFSEKVFTSKAKQQEQKLTALDALYKTVAENRALNRNGNLIMKMTRAFDQYGNYNGYTPDFQVNPTLGITANPTTASTAPAGKFQPAGGIQGLTPGKSYYNRRTGRTLRFDGSSLVEVK